MGPRLETTSDFGKSGAEDNSQIVLTWERFRETCRIETFGEVDNGRSTLAANHRAA
jgi:hypothetical protein